MRTVYEYSVLRYVPDVERGEFLNVGLMMMCKRYRWLKTAIILNPDRIRHCFPDADMQRLETQLRVFEGNDVPDVTLPVEERYRWMAAVKSAIIQCSPSHPGIILSSDDASRDEVVALLNACFAALADRLC